jgi:hypothetical protein
MFSEQKERPDRKESQKNEGRSTGEPATTSLSSRSCHAPSRVRVADRRGWVEVPILQGRT